MPAPAGKTLPAGGGTQRSMAGERDPRQGQSYKLAVAVSDPEQGREMRWGPAACLCRQLLLLGSGLRKGSLQAGNLLLHRLELGLRLRQLSERGVQRGLGRRERGALGLHLRVVGAGGGGGAGGARAGGGAGRGGCARGMCVLVVGQRRLCPGREAATACCLLGHQVLMQHAAELLAPSGPAGLTASLLAQAKSSNLMAQWRAGRCMAGACAGRQAAQQAQQAAAHSPLHSPRGPRCGTGAWLAPTCRWRCRPWKPWTQPRA